MIKPAASSLLRRIPLQEIENTLSLSEILEEDLDINNKRSLNNLYNLKLMYFLRRNQWIDFFYIYKTAKVLEHGSSIETEIIGANGYLLAYQDTKKAKIILDLLPVTTATELAKTYIELYEDLKTKGMEPNSSDWVTLITLTLNASTLKPSLNKWDLLRRNPRMNWHYKLRPWKYRRHFLMSNKPSI